MLDVRSSPVVSGEDDPPLPQAHLLQGAGGVKPAPVLNAVLYIETEQVKIFIFFRLGVEIAFLSTMPHFICS